MTGFGFTTPLFISVMLLSQVVTSKEIEVPLEAKSLDHETAYPYELPSALITPEVQRGLRVLFQRELEHYEFDENNHDISGNYEEVNSYLWLLGYLQVIEAEPLARFYWPRNFSHPNGEGPRGPFNSADFEMDLYWQSDGTFSELKMRFCRAGVRGERRYFRRSSSGCRALSESFQKWFSNWALVPLLGQRTYLPRVFRLTSQHRASRFRVSFLNYEQIPEYGVYGLNTYPPGGIRTLKQLLKAENWRSLESFMRNRLDMHPLNQYYLGLALMNQKKIAEAITHWNVFLEDAGYDFPEFSTHAITQLIDHFYDANEHINVASFPRRYIARFDSFDQANVLTDAITYSKAQYFSSLTLVDQPRIATALKGFIQLQEDQIVRSDPDIRSLVNEQLYGLLKQIKEVAHAEGRAR